MWGLSCVLAQSNAFGGWRRIHSSTWFGRIENLAPRPCSKHSLTEQGPKALSVRSATVRAVYREGLSPADNQPVGTGRNVDGEQFATVWALNDSTHVLLSEKAPPGRGSIT
jgi:hypothetical protein